MVVIPHKVSSTGRTKELNIIYSTQNVNIKSRAALILLNNELLQQDEDYLNDDVQIYLDKRHEYLNNKLKLEGGLNCEYCGKKYLEIGLRSKKDAHINNANPRLATIDHIIPRSLNLIDPLDENNWTVACKNCNKRKGSLSKEEFIKCLEYRKKNKNKQKRINKQKRKLSLSL